jgi:acyl carrier protein
MELNDFVKNFAEQFDDTDASEINATTAFHDLDEWSSLIGMSVIAMVKTQYGKTLTGKEIKNCTTVEQLFNLISNKE